MLVHYQNTQPRIHVITNKTWVLQKKILLQRQRNFANHHSCLTSACLKFKNSLAVKVTFRLHVYLGNTHQGIHSHWKLLTLNLAQQNIIDIFFF